MKFRTPPQELKDAEKEELSHVYGDGTLGGERPTAHEITQWTGGQEGVVWSAKSTVVSLISLWCGWVLGGWGRDCGGV